MLHLLTFGVLVFQVAILVTTVGLAFLGRRWLNITTLAWVAFTVFGSIYTFGLLLLQLFTVAVAYVLGLRVVRKRAVATVARV